MDPNAGFDPRKVTRALLRRSREGALASLMPETGAPYCSLVNVATQHDGMPLLLISRLAVHTRNVLADSRVSLLLSERGPGDPLEGARIMVAGVAERVDAGDIATVRRRYLAAHPAAEAFVDFDDFSFFRIRPSGVHLVAGFGRIVDLAAPDILTDIEGAEALVEAETEAVAHMNADHREALNLYASRLLGLGEGEWRCTGCDPDGIDLQNGTRTARLEFPRRIISPGALRGVLKDLAAEARGKGAD
jgi:putative heme iron utilization protein